MNSKNKRSVFKIEVESTKGDDGRVVAHVLQSLDRDFEVWEGRRVTPKRNLPLLEFRGAGDTDWPLESRPGRSFIQLAKSHYIVLVEWNEEGAQVIGATPYFQYELSRASASALKSPTAPSLRYLQATLGLDMMVGESSRDLEMALRAATKVKARRKLVKPNKPQPQLVSVGRTESWRPLHQAFATADA